jgi:hypothetical protein
VLSRLNISLRTPSPPSSRPSSISSQFTPKTPRTVARLQKQARIIKDLIVRRSKSPPSTLILVVDQILRGHYLSLHNLALALQDNANPRAANEKIIKKRNRSARQIPYEAGLTVEEGLQLVEQLNQPVEADGVVSHAQGKLPSQANPPRTRAPPRCSGCRETGHGINTCKNRYI